MIKNTEYPELFAQIAKTTDPAERKKLKQKLPICTPCINVSTNRDYAHITSFTGLLVMDFDHIEESELLRDTLFDHNFVIAAWLSPSRKGVKCFIQIPICKDPDEFKEYFFGLFNYFPGSDISCQNAVQPLFLSTDPDIRFRTDATEWNIKGINKKAKPTITLAPTNFTRDEKRVAAKIKSAFAKIIDNGHPQLRSACLSLGGYVGNNYLTESEAIQLVDSLIENHPYLSKGIAGYKRTARLFIGYGQRNPLCL